jgi:hypothetical protein
MSRITCMTLKVRRVYDGPLLDWFNCDQSSKMILATGAYFKSIGNIAVERSRHPKNLI